MLGSRLEDISSGSQPYEGGEDGNIATKHSLTGSIAEVASALHLRQNDLEISQIAQAVEAQVLEGGVLAMVLEGGVLGGRGGSCDVVVGHDCKVSTSARANSIRRARL